MLKLPDDIEHLDTVFPRGAFVVRKVCESYKGGRVLDIGCGKGRIARFLGGRLGIDVLGVDIDEEEIRRAEDSNEYENVQFACVDTSEIAEEFAGILLVEVLEHIEEPQTFLKEVHRLSEDNGFLILTIPNGYSLKEIVAAGVRCLKTIPFLAKLVDGYKKAIPRDEVFNESPHVQQFSLRKIRTLIMDSGFTIAEEFYGDIWSGFLWKYLPWVPVPLFARRIESKIARYLPYFLLGDWGFLCFKKPGQF